MFTIYMCSIIYKLNSVKKTFNSKVLLFEKLPLKAKTSYKLNTELEPLKFHFPSCSRDNISWVEFTFTIQSSSLFGSYLPKKNPLPR